ncbi:MAG: B12-binding domain-containing radical SAM protein [Prolixibacteraceae bacterium]|jgi:radical SAM superfamily enzyme YgiQ (UPF0313 family)|nr:B12-binding domain-containing radical SAM protein [Prolixibacteraceae bacterium]
MKILFVYPVYPDTFWSFKHALKFVSKKAANVPLGIITVAALLPQNWEKKLIDMNVSALNNKDLQWADYVFISAMSVQRASAVNVLERCKALDKKVVAGGPMFTEEADQFPEVDHLVLNEAELTFPLFLEDLRNNKAKQIYTSDQFANITQTPVPDYSLVKINKYSAVSIQYSRGCPYDCEFCDITALFGRKVRTKSTVQIISELDNLLEIGWSGGVFFVDDNFIGHKKKLKSELLPAIIAWMKQNNNPFQFSTEASIDLADDKELMQLMVEAGFFKAFVGIETPDEECLKECNKTQNNKRNLLQGVHNIQNAGIEVSAGFIVGFDNDPSNIFQRQIDFIQQSGIITAMVGLLNAPRLSKLFKRLKTEGRINDTFNGNNTSYSMNFIPKMNKEELLTGYRKIVKEIYSGKVFHDRVFSFLKRYQPRTNQKNKITRSKVMALIKSIFYLGIFNVNRKYFWHLIFWSLFNKPAAFPLAVTYSIYGYHFNKVFKNLK